MISHLRTLAMVLVLLALTSAQAQTSDSIRHQNINFDAFTHSALGEASIVSAPLFVGSLIVKNADGKFADRLGSPFPAHTKHEYYLQYAPAAALLGMKAAGLKSESSWAQMLTADAFAVACMGGAVELLKHTSDVERPDGSDNHSFPSGHTATAFMTATMLSHEYGQRYPWVAVMGYASATATGMMRIAQNRHNLSDVMAGASIGIMATELGYAISDLIFHKPLLSDIDRLREDHDPSFVGYNVSFNVPVGNFRVADNVGLKTSSGCQLSVEGAWFANSHVGIGAQLAYNRWRIYVGGEPMIHPLEYFSGDAGAYFYQPCSSRFGIMAKALVGYGKYKRYEGAIPVNGKMLDIEPHGGFDLKCGVSINMRVRRSLTYSLGCTYGNLPAATTTGQRICTISIDARMAYNF